MELSQSSPTHMQRLQRSPLHPGLSHHAKQILGPAFGSRLLRLSIWHNFLIFSPTINQEMNPGLCVTLCIRKDWCVCAWHTYLQPLPAYTLSFSQLRNALLSSNFSLSPLAIITGSIHVHHLKRDAIYTISAVSLFLEQTILPNMVGHMCLQLAAHVEARATQVHVILSRCVRETDLSKTSVKYGLASNTVGYLHRG